MVPPQTRLDRNRHLNGIDHSPGYLQHLRDITEHTSTGTFPCHLLNRAAEIDVKHVGTGSLDHLCGLNHRAGFSTVNLYGRRPLRRFYMELPCCGGDITD